VGRVSPQVPHPLFLFHVCVSDSPSIGLGSAFAERSQGSLAAACVSLPRLAGVRESPNPRPKIRQDVFEILKPVLPSKMGFVLRPSSGDEVRGFSLIPGVDSREAARCSCSQMTQRVFGSGRKRRRRFPDGCPAAASFIPHGRDAAGGDV
jgi:hypothetical protein